MSRLPIDQFSLAIVLRLHAGRATVAELAADLGAAPSRIEARLAQLRVGSVVARVGESNDDAPAYQLIPDAYRAFAPFQPPDCPMDVVDPEVTRARLELLRRCQLFAPLSKLELVSLARQSQCRHYRPGEILFFEGEECLGLYVVESGLVRIFKQTHSSFSAPREQTLRLMGPGDSYNEVPVFDGGPNPASAESIEESTILLIPKNCVTQLLPANPDFAQTVIAGLAGRMRHLLTMICDLSMRQVPSRVAKVLLQSIEPIEGVGAGVEHHPRLTQREIADMAGTAREVVARALKDIERQGAITIERGRITIIDPAKLEAML